ncbi:MAG TPA: AAA family ATPase [Acidimicrobiales bacterium]|nr:AAA family ATPase [Acidimicrobiales bacterium]
MPNTSIEPAGLAPPDEGPTFGFKSRERLEDRATRKPMVLWDRIKIFALLVGLFFFFVLAATGDNPILPFREAVDQQVQAKWWLLALAGLEIVRQIHYLISERSAGWHRFWTVKFFGGVEQRSGRMNDWNRYRMGRAMKRLFVLFLVALALGAMFDTSPILGLVKLPTAIWSALPLIFQLFFAVAFIIIQFGAMFWFLSRGGTDVYFPDDIKTRFSDVWGQDNVLEKIKENIVFLEDPESIENKGGYVPGGILLWGPPGTGKTLMAEAVAGETGKPYVFVDPGAFTAMFMGVGILKVKSLYRKLRKLSVRYGGVIVFFDEADSLGSRGALSQGGVFGGKMSTPWSASDRCNGLTYVDPSVASLALRHWIDASSGPEIERRWRDRIMMGMGMGGGGMGTLQALLAEMSGLKKPRGFMNRVVRRALGFKPKPPPKYRMLTMMATNMPQSLDEALLRPGRIDRIYKVGYPSKPGRVRTYEGYLAKVQHSLTAADIDKLATITPYATGATIKDMVNEALINAIRDGRESITWNDVVKAKQLKDLGPPEDVEYIERERHAVAVHEACHAVAAYRVRAHMTIDIATIEKGGTYLGMVASIPPEDQFTRWRSEYEADIMVALASLVGERMFFDGDNSSGVSGDLESATQIATLMEGYWGMGSTAADADALGDAVGGDGGKPGKGGGGGEQKDDPNKLLEGTLGSRIEDKLGELMDRTERLIRENRRAVLAVAHALETHKTVTGEDIRAIIEGRPGTLIDGTPYGTPEFEQLAEDYHRRVMAAHKHHAKVDVPLPLLNGRYRVAQPQGDVLIEVELSEAELAGRAFRRPVPPPAPELGTGNGSGNGSGNGTAGGGGEPTGDGESHPE